MGKEDNVIARLIRGYEVVASDLRINANEINRYYYSQDEQGSTLYITNEEQVIENSYTYDAFGNILTKEENIHNRITYTGQQYDTITQQYYLRARYYNPIIGRFTQEDVYRGDGLNLYSYCANNPANYYDPSGYESAKSLCGPKEEQMLGDGDDSNRENKGESKAKVRNGHLADNVHPETGVPFDKDGFPVFEPIYEMNLDPEDYLKSRNTHFDRAGKDLFYEAQKDSELRDLFTSEDLDLFKEGLVPEKFTWHHHQDLGRMQLVDYVTHRKTGHTGGFNIWGAGKK